jgi:hypothetical protein
MVYWDNIFYHPSCALRYGTHLIKDSMIVSEKDPFIMGTNIMKFIEFIDNYIATASVKHQDNCATESINLKQKEIDRLKNKIKDLTNSK